jgi:hypothetical protein
MKTATIQGPWGSFDTYAAEESYKQSFRDSFLKIFAPEETGGITLPSGTVLFTGARNGQVFDDKVSWSSSTGFLNSTINIRGDLHLKKVIGKGKSKVILWHSREAQELSDFMFGLFLSGNLPLPNTDPSYHMGCQETINEYIDKYNEVEKNLAELRELAIQRGQAISKKISGEESRSSALNHAWKIRPN